jgi:hypothetical protein
MEPPNYERSFVMPTLMDKESGSLWLGCSMQITKDDLKECRAVYRQIRVNVIGRRLAGRAISTPDPNVSRPKITDVTYLLGQKSRTL